MKLKNKFRLNLEENREKKESLAKAFDALNKLDQSVSEKVKGGLRTEIPPEWYGIHFSQIIV